MKIMPLADFDPVTAFPDYQPDRKRVEEIIRNVRENGDQALLDLTRTYDRVNLTSLEAGLSQEKDPAKRITPELKAAIQDVCGRIRKTAEIQKTMFQNREWEIEPGVWAGQRIIPVQRAGIYVPGGRYPLVSSLLMGCVPAQVAGVEEIVVCTPPGSEGKLHPALSAAAETAGVDRIFRVGGAQAIAGMAYGTESIPAVDFIAGPGNVYVNIAKKLVYGQVGIDFIAGPTEILIIADAGAEPEWAAADLIAQAEHDENARPVMITNSPELARMVIAGVSRLLDRIKTKKTAAEALGKNGCILLTGSLEKAVIAANLMAPEHLHLDVRDPEKWIDRLKNYGTLFLGGYACEVLGDYSSGLNHVLPTSRAARYSGGLSVRNFLKIQTVLKVDEQGFMNIGPAAQRLAEAEGLAGHAYSVEVRRKAVKGER